MRGLDAIFIALGNIDVYLFGYELKNTRNRIYLISRNDNGKMQQTKRMKQIAPHVFWVGLIFYLRIVHHVLLGRFDILFML